MSSQNSHTGHFAGELQVRPQVRQDHVQRPIHVPGRVPEEGVDPVDGVVLVRLFILGLVVLARRVQFLVLILPVVNVFLELLDNLDIGLISARGPLLAGPEGTKRAVLPNREVDSLLVRAADVAGGHDHALDAVTCEQGLHLLGDFRITGDVRPDESLQISRAVPLAQHDPRGDLRRHLVIRAVIADGADREFAVPVRLRLGGTADLYFNPLPQGRGL